MSMAADQLTAREAGLWQQFSGGRAGRLFATAARVDVGWWFWGGRLRVGVLDGELVLFAAGSRPFVQRTPGPVSAVLLAGLQAYDKHCHYTEEGAALRPLIQDALEDRAYGATAAVEKRLNMLSFIGNSAPLFGMTGTVTGMIKSFAAIAGAGALEGSIVAGGIAEALITTAAGLLIAMGAVIPYHYFMGRADAIMMEVHEASSELLDFITLKHTKRQL